MKALIKKEIRLLLPWWIAAMLLAIIPRPFIILCSPGNPAFYQSSISSIAESIFAIGLLILGINSFGQELACNTFSALLSQPMKRPRLWLIKVGTLSTAFISVWLAAVLIARWQFGVFDEWDTAQYARPEFSDAFEFLTISALVVFSGGLWTTLLLRQITGAVWFTLLIPLAITIGIGAVFQDWINWDESVNKFILAALLLYSIAGFLLARRLFIRAQDVQWTGGEVSLPFGNSVSKTRAGSLLNRSRHWFLALAWKELQLHQATFFIAAIVLVVHLTACLIRRFHPHIENPTLDFVLENFWVLWLLMPLLIGAAAIAEEQRMGTFEHQLCLPVSRSAQLFFKFSIALLLSVFLGTVIPASIEAGVCGASLGDSGGWVIARDNVMPDQWHWVVGVTAAIFFISFYASSLGRTALEAIGLAIVVAAVIYLYEVMTAFAITSKLMRLPGFYSNPKFGIELLSRYLDLPILLLLVGGLTFSNFNHIHHNRKFWLRNIAAILAVFICIPIVARAIYFRPWEIFLSPEPRGPVRITSPAQVKLVSSMDAVYAISPIGRLWVKPCTYGINHVESGREQFVSGSNWVDVAANEVEALAVQSDGALWSLGDSTGPATKTQIGTGHDWSRVAAGLDGFLILKKDGSLWAWGTHPYHRKGESDHSALIQKLQRDFASPPVRVSDDTNWAALYSTHLFSPYARNSDGNLWLLAGKHLKQETNVDNQWLSMQFDNSLSHVEVRTNGDLLYIDQMRFIRAMADRQPARRNPGHGSLEQLGEPAKWKTAAIGPINGWQTIVAIRSDGTLWKFPLPKPPGFAPEPSVQLGTRSDWVAVSQGFSLASDGSLWTWDEPSRHAWLAPSRKPVYMGNIFQAQESGNESPRNNTP